MSVNWSVLAGSSTLGSGLWTRSTGGRDAIYTFGLILPDSVTKGQAVTLRFTFNSGSPSYVALDNLVFDQVPEPSTVALGALGLGLGALAMRRRRK